MGLNHFRASHFGAGHFSTISHLIGTVVTIVSDWIVTARRRLRR